MGATSAPTEDNDELLETGEGEKLIQSSAGANAGAGGGTQAPRREWSALILEFAMCFVALQSSYLLWGMMQELIMDTQFKATPLTPSGKFPSAVFCVFSNRILAVFVSAVVCFWKHGTLRLAAPLLSFTPSAVSNTVSSWSQYEALVYVSFALQTIFKSIKILPVMLMGKLLKGTQYSLEEYVEAIAITTGVMMFSLSKTSWVSATPQYEAFGIGLLSLYIISDSFTSQWQSKVYRDYPHVDSFQMMYGVNVSAVILTALALFASNELSLVLEFVRYNPTSLYYNIVTAVCSSTGQFVIYYIIKRYGPVIFTIMMTTRQMLSILISNYYFRHSMPMQSYFGCLLVFSAILYSSYRQLRKAGSQK